MTRSFNSLSPPLRGAALMVAAGLLFALVNTLIQHGAMNLAIPSARLAFWQYLIALLFSLPWIFWAGPQMLRTGQLPLHLLRVALSAAGVQMWVMGLAHVPIWQAIALIMLSPFFVTLGAGLFLREAMTLERWLAVGLGFAGGMIILAPWSDQFSLSALLPLGAALTWAAVSLLTKHMTRSDPPETLALYLLLLLTPINAVVASGEGLALEAGPVIWVLIGAGILTGLAQLALAKAYSVADAAFLQPFDHMKLPFNVGLGVLAFGFVPPGSLWLGAILIIGASAFLLNREGQARMAAAR
ncbi:MAG: DMT family transporter [Pseudomonadota bacterium]